jgi:Flp pilus assembly protein TadG
MMNKQKGAIFVEFALIGLLFFSLIFTIVEIGRWMFVMETLNEATRRGARIGAVCPVYHDYIKIATVFGEREGGSVQNSPLVNGLSTANVSVTYYQIDDTGAVTSYIVPANPTLLDLAPIKIVEVAIENYTHTLLAIPPCPGCNGIFSGSVQVPRFATRVPVESLGTLQAEPNYCY